MHVGRLQASPDRHLTEGVVGVQVRALSVLSRLNSENIKNKSHTPYASLARQGDMAYTMLVVVREAQLHLAPPRLLARQLF